MNKRSVMMCAAVAALAGCGPGSNAPAPPAVVPKPAHNYVMQDGMKYGYPSAISDDQRKAGQVAEKLVMALYAGEREGKHQAHIVDGLTVTAIECEPPCQYLKIMTLVDADYLRQTVKVEHLAAQPDSVGASIMQDAMGGKLRKYGTSVDGKNYEVWVDEKRGLTRRPIAPPAAKKPGS